MSGSFNTMLQYSAAGLNNMSASAPGKSHLACFAEDYRHDELPHLLTKGRLSRYLQSLPSRL